MILSALASLLLAQAAATSESADRATIDRVLYRCEGATGALPQLEPAGLERALAGTALVPEGWQVAMLPAALSPAQPCWLALRLAPSSTPRFVWIGEVQAAITAYLDGAQLWVRGRERDPFWRSDQGFAGFDIPAPLLSSDAPRVLLLRAGTPNLVVRMKPLVVIDPARAPALAFERGGIANIAKDATAILLWAAALVALVAFAVARARALLWFGAATSGFAILITGMSIEWIPVDHTLIARTSALSLMLSMPFYALFFQDLYRIHVRREFLYVVLAQVVVVAIPSALVDPSGIGPLAMATIPVFLGWFAYGIYLNARARRQGDPLARLVVWGYAVFFGFVLIDAWRYVSTGELNSPIFPVGMFAFVASIIAAVGMRFHRLNTESRRMLAQLQAAAGSLNGIVASLQSASTQLSAATAEQVTALTETATTTTEMNQTSALSAERAGELIDRGVAAAQVVEDGRSAADSSRGAIQAISSALSTVSAASRELSERVQRVDRIIDTVSFLADQSAALAINASIEASRAGEAGQGFAAVAREVRALANDSRRATAEVREVLAEIRSRTLEVEGQVSEGGATVNAGVQQVARLAQVVAALGGTIDDAVGLMRQVESSARQNRAGVEQVLQAVTNIQRASESIRDGAESLTVLSRQASALSSGLVQPEAK